MALNYILMFSLYIQERPSLEFLYDCHLLQEGNSNDDQHISRMTSKILCTLLSSISQYFAYVM